jgi:hypothetical protein
MKFASFSQGVVGNCACATRLASCVMLICATVPVNDGLAATVTINGSASRNGDNQPFFTGGGPAGFVGTASGSMTASSHVTGTGLQVAGNSVLPDLSDGNGILMGVTLVYNVGFTVAATSSGSTLNDGGPGGLAVRTSGETAASGNRDLINTNDVVVFTRRRRTISSDAPPAKVGLPPAATNCSFTLRMQK